MRRSKLIIAFFIFGLVGLAAVSYDFTKKGKVVDLDPQARTIEFDNASDAEMSVVSLKDNSPTLRESVKQQKKNSLAPNYWENNLRYVVDADTAESYLANIEKVNEYSLQRHLIHALFDRLAKVDATLIALFLSSNYSTESFTNLVRGEGLQWLSGTSGIDTDMLLNGLISNNADLDTISTIYSRWANKDPMPAIHWLEPYNGHSFFSELLPLVLFPLIEKEPQVAIDKIQLYKGNKNYESLMFRYVQVISNNDPYAAMIWANTVEQPLSTELEYLILRKWVKKSPDEAVAYLYSQPPKKRDLLMKIAGLTDPATVQASSELTSDLDDSIQEGSFLQWLANDPKSAISWVQRSDSQSSDLGGVLADLPRVNLRASKQIYSSLSRDSQIEIVEGIAHRLALIDPEVASSWIEDNVKDIQQRVLADIALFGVVAAQNPQHALNSAYFSHRNSKDRLKVLESVATVVGQSNRKVLENWVQSTGLTEEERRVLHASLE